VTPQERQVLEEAEEAAVQSAQEFADAQMTSGIRPPPTIDETETSLEPQLFGFEFGQQPAAESEPTSSAPVPVETACCQLTLEFHDVLLDCGCLDPNPTIIEDDGFFNDNPIQICVGRCSDTDCTSFTNRGDGCFCGGDGVADHHYFHEKEWPGEAGCPGDPEFEFDILACGFQEAPIISLQLISGVWHLLMYNWSGTILLFYGTTADLTMNIDNQLICGGDIPSITNTCLWPSLAPPVMIASENGYATISSSGIICGACCYDTDCVQSTEFACNAKGGVYQGDGTTCSPDPC
jgi:hypothetical protein